MRLPKELKVCTMQVASPWQHANSCNSQEVLVVSCWALLHQTHHIAHSQTTAQTQTHLTGIGK